MSPYYVRMTRGPMSRLEIVGSAKEAFDLATELIAEGCDTIEVRMPTGKVLRKHELPTLADE